MNTLIALILLLGNVFTLFAHLRASEISYQHAERNIITSLAAAGFSIVSLLLLLLLGSSSALLGGMLFGVAVLSLVFFLLGPMLAGQSEA